MKELTQQELNDGMKKAYEIAKESNDPHTKVGACIRTLYNNVFYMDVCGCNTIPEGLPTEGEGNYLDTKYPYVTHAEMNAITKALPRFKLNNATIYCTLFPCEKCMQLIIASGIKRVVYDCDKYADKDFTIAAKRLAQVAGIELIQYEGDVE